MKLDGLAHISQTRLRLLAQIGGAMALTFVFVGFAIVIWKGPWLTEHQPQQLELLGWGMLASAFLILVALVAITEIALNLKAGKSGIEARMDQDQSPDEERTTVTTQVDITK